MSIFVEDRAVSQIEAAVILGVKPNWLEQARHFMTGPKYFKAGRLCRYWVSDLKAYAESRTIDPAALRNGRVEA